jgi:hypothetical protein
VSGLMNARPRGMSITTGRQRSVVAS